MLLVSYIQQYFNTSITILTNQVWKLLIALFKVPNTGAFTVTHSNVCVPTRWQKAASLYTFSMWVGYQGWEQVKLECPTSGYSKHPHDAEDGGVDGDDVRLQLLHDDASDGEEDDQDI